jgi:hypothetical protein
VVVGGAAVAVVGGAVAVVVDCGRVVVTETFVLGAVDRDGAVVVVPQAARRTGTASKATDQRLPLTGPLCTPTGVRNAQSEGAGQRASMRRRNPATVVSTTRS